MSTGGTSKRGDLIEIDDNIAPVLVTDELGKLHYRDEQVALTRFDRSYVAAAGKAADEGRDLALIYPSAPTYLQLPVLLAVGYQSYDPPPTLFISNRSGAGIREQYFDVGIGESLPGAPIQSLADFTAPLVKTGDGRKLSYITHHKPQNWGGDYRGVSVVHSTLGRKIAGDFPTEDELPLSAIVLDLTTKLLDDFSIIEQYQEHASERDIPLLYLFDTPCHRHLERLEDQNAEKSPSEQALFWGYSHSVLEQAGEDVLAIESPKSSFKPRSITSENVDQNSPFEASIPVLRNIINRINREVTELTYGDLQPAATDAYSKIQDVASYVRHRRSTFPRSVSHAMRDLYFAYSYLSTLPTSVEFHDDIMAFESGWGAGSTLDQMIDNVRKNYQSLESDVTGAGNMLEDACDELSRMRKQLVNRNPKADEIVRELHLAIENDESLVVLTSTNRQTSLLRSFVSELAGISGKELNDVGIQFHSLYNTHTIPMGDRLLFPGVPTKSHRPAVLSGVTSEQTYLSYEWETDRLKYWLEELQRIVDQRCGPATLRHTLEQLGVSLGNLEAYIDLPEEGQAPVPLDMEADSSRSESDSLDDGSEDEVSTTRKQGVGGNPSTSVGTSDSVVEENTEVDPDTFRPDSDAFRNAAEYFDNGIEQESVDEGRETVSSSGEGTVDAVKVSLSGGACIFERPNGLLWVYDEQKTGKKRRRRRAANALEKGDVVLITERESRRDIFEHVVEKIRSEVPEFKKYSKMLEYWRTNLERIVAENDLSHTDMASALQTYAEENDVPEASRTYHAVRGWVTKEAIGPDNYQVIEALGEIYDVDIYKEMAMEIEASLEEIRDLHRRVGHHLDKILFSAGSAEDGDTWLFEEFNIRVGDLQDAVEYRRVKRVSEDTFEVNSRDLGRVFD
ncbi:DrmE family protein [Halomicrococcus sp. SG-WS-1]|uniref:DrmE family protein n=1 Tax=Halomicrococcus sp. SG-WS-1 TaxID=3439057 RepID=UPI003F7AA2F6